MEAIHDQETGTCEMCGGPLNDGPVGPQCMHCLLSLGAADDAFADVAEFFPELNIQEEIAHGGFGTVFRAEQRRMKRPVALKFLDRILTHSPDAVALFEREMVTVASLSHPGIVQAYDAGERDDHWYIIMELVDGDDCGALLRKHGTLPVAESCEIIRQAALALHHAHGKGLVHRDVKPGNLMVAKGDSQPVKVLDFGLAGIAVAPLIDNPDAVKDDTTGDRFMGTLEYVAPEQIEAPGKVDVRADIYALGATLRRMLTGKPAREGMSEKTLALRMKAIATTPIESIAEFRPDLPVPLVTACDRMLALSPEARPRDMVEVAALLAPWCVGAELPRLFTAGPLAEKPFVLTRNSHKALWVTAALAATVTISAAIFHAWKETALRTGVETPKLAAVAVLKREGPPPPRLAFSAGLIAFRHLDDRDTPRLISADWETESETFTNDKFLSARFLSEGRIAYLNRATDNTTIRTQRPGDPVEKHTVIFAEKRPSDSIETFTVAPDGQFAIGHRREPEALHIRRFQADGKPLKALRYNFAADFPRFTYELGRKAMLAAGQTVFDALPGGMVVVTADNIPPNTGLSAGDVLVAEEGHMKLLKDYRTKPSLWRFRFDNDEPASRLGDLDAKGHCLIDVAVSRHGVFVLNRTDTIPTDFEDDPRNLNDRVIRWDKDGFHRCILDKPLYDPTGIVADPTSTDLYAIQGGFIPSVSIAIQRVLRLRLTKPDHYAVEVIADRFGKMGICGIGISADGQRLIVTDKGNGVILVLKKKR
jgi:serine/threonine protein kinase